MTIATKHAATKLRIDTLQIVSAVRYRGQGIILTVLLCTRELRRIQAHE